MSYLHIWNIPIWSAACYCSGWRDHWYFGQLLANAITLMEKKTWAGTFWSAADKRSRAQCVSAIDLYYLWHFYTASILLGQAWSWHLIGQVSCSLFSHDWIVFKFNSIYILLNHTLYEDVKNRSDAINIHKFRFLLKQWDYAKYYHICVNLW